MAKSVSRKNKNAPNEVSRDIRCILFSDMSGFSRITGTEQMKLFAKHILTRIETEINTEKESIVKFNMWGDGLMALFDNPISACHFALRLRDFFREDMTASGLNHDLNIRTALHLGVIYHYGGILSNLGDCILSEELTLAARIEPVVRPGEVWVSVPVISDTKVAMATDLIFDQLGKVPLAKQYGSVQLHSPRRPCDKVLPEYSTSNNGKTKENLKSIDQTMSMAKLKLTYANLISKVEDNSVAELITELYANALQLIADEG